MAETALERFKKDQQDQEESKKTEPKVRELDQVKESFLKALEGVTEPTPPVRYLKPFNPISKRRQKFS